MNVLQKLPVAIQYMIRSYCGGTPSAEAIKQEIKKILPIIESDRLGEDQTIWSIRTIYWFEYYDENSSQMYQQTDVPLKIRYELDIAKGIHLCTSCNNCTYQCIPNYYKEELQFAFADKYRIDKWWEQYLTQLNPLYKLDF